MKRALITSGGGAKGAFTIGALRHLANKGIANYDIISGTSTGSLIATMACIGRIDILEHIYTSVDNDDILNKQNIINNMMSGDKPYIFDSSPLTQMINTYLNIPAYDAIMASPTILCLTAISLQTGRITVFCTKPVAIPATNIYDVRAITTRDEMINALSASSNQAAFLPPVKIGAEQFVDGGNRDVVPTRVAVDLKPDEIFVLSNNPSDMFQHAATFKNLLDVLLRAISIFIQEVRDNDLAVLDDYIAKNPGTKKYQIKPDTDLDPNHPTGLRFDSISMAYWMQMGRLAAANVYP